MSLPQTKYINIVSAAGGTPIVGKRTLMGRVFTSNMLVPVNQVIEFTGGSLNAMKSIGDFFGTTSAEYGFANKYFQVGKTANAPQAISFARYSANAIPATLIGSVNASTLSDLQAISAGTLTVTINGTEKTADSINLSAATSLADVATAIQTAIDSTDITVSYDTDLARFILSTAESGSGQTLSFATGTVADALGWTENLAILSDGSDGDTPVGTVSTSAELTNNFFSFTFLDTILTTSQLADLAQWVNGQNVSYLFSHAVTPSNASPVQLAVKGQDGVGLTVDKFDENAAFMPMSRIASIDYNKANAAISMNYQQFTGITPSVRTDSEAALYDSLKINYYGVTQQAGQEIAWYQPGVLQGSISDMGVYANEAWLKDSFVTDLLNLRLGLNSLPANNVGISLVLSTLMQTINKALFNGVILPGKTLDAIQQAYIAQITGNSDAWQTVQSNGYYIDCNLEKYTENGVEKYKASFLLVYSKGDSINYIDGRDILI